MPDLLAEKRGHTALLTLNRPERLNADHLRDARRARPRAQRRGARPRGARHRDHRRGARLLQRPRPEGGGRGARHRRRAQRRRRARTSERASCRRSILQQLDTPVICALNGAAAGYGLDLALGCDIRLMAAGARLVPGFAKRGILPESGGTWYLPRLVGWAKACEIGFLGDDLPAERALALGLVNAVVARRRGARRGDPLGDAKIAANAPLAVQAMKRLFRHGLAEDFEAHSHHVLMQLVQLFRSRGLRGGRRVVHRAAPTALHGALSATGAPRHALPRRRPATVLVGGHWYLAQRLVFDPGFRTRRASCSRRSPGDAGGRSRSASGSCRGGATRALSGLRRSGWGSPSISSWCWWRRTRWRCCSGSSARGAVTGPRSARSSSSRSPPARARPACVAALAGPAAPPGRAAAAPLAARRSTASASCS